MHTIWHYVHFKGDLLSSWVAITLQINTGGVGYDWQWHCHGQANSGPWRL